MSESAIQRWINKVGKFLGIDLKYVLSGNTWLGLFHFIAVFSVLLLTILFGRILSKQTYGEYSFLIAIAEIIGIFTLNGFSTVIIQAVARGYEGTFMYAVQKMRQWSFLIVLVAFSFAAYYFIGHNSNYGFIFILIGITLPFYKVSSLSDALLIGRKDFKISSFYNITANISLTVLLIIAVLLYPNLLVLAATYLFGRTGIEYVVYRSTLRRFPPRNTEVQKGSVSYAVDLSLLKFIAMLADQADSVLLFFFSGPVNLALYSFVVGGPELLKGFIKNITALALPRFSERSLVEIRKTLLLKVVYVCIVMAIVVTAYIVAAPYLFRILLPNYLAAVPYSQFFSLSLILVAAATLPISALQANIAKERLYKFTIAAEIIQIVLLFLGIKYYGMVGAIGAYFIVRTFRLIYSSYLVWQG